MTPPGTLAIASMQAALHAGGMAGPRRPRGVLPAGRPLRHVRHDVQPHLGAVPGEDGAFLINPYGMLYEEITASSLIKIDIDGNILAKPDFGALDYGINRAGYVIHGAVHDARHDVACVIHTHTRAGMAVSALECGLLPITQTSMRFLQDRLPRLRGRGARPRGGSVAGARPGRRRGADPAQPRPAHRRARPSARRSTGCTGSSSPASSQLAAMATGAKLDHRAATACCRRPT